MYTEEVTDESAQLRRRKFERAQSEARADRRTAMAQSQEEEMENVFDVINTEYSGGKGLVFPRNVGGKIINGVVTDSKGNLVNGTIILAKEELPAQIIAAMRGLQINPSTKNEVKVVDGRIMSIKPKGMGEIDRDMIMLGQKKFYRPKKGEKVTFGGDVYNVFLD